MFASMKVKYYFPLIIAVVLLIQSCAPTRLVRPIEEKKWAAMANTGGPLVGYGSATIPVPLSAVGAAYGVNKKTTAFANVHTTSLLFGVIQTDLGVLRQLKSQNKWSPEICITPAANLMLDIWETNFRFYPSLDINLSWNYKQKPNYIYTGMSNWFELNGQRTLDQKQKTRWLPAFHLGHTFCRTKWNYSLESKFIAPFSSNEKLVVDYKSFGSSGAIGIYFSVIRKF